MIISIADQILIDANACVRTLKFVRCARSICSKRTQPHHVYAALQLSTITSRCLSRSAVQLLCDGFGILAAPGQTKAHVFRILFRIVLLTQNLFDMKAVTTHIPNLSVSCVQFCKPSVGTLRVKKYLTTWQLTQLGILTPFCRSSLFTIYS